MKWSVPLCISVSCFTCSSGWTFFPSGGWRARPALMGSQADSLVLKRYFHNAILKAMVSARYFASDGERSQERAPSAAVPETRPRLLSSGDGLGTPQADAPGLPRARVLTNSKPKVRVSRPEGARSRVTRGSDRPPWREVDDELRRKSVGRAGTPKLHHPGKPSHHPDQEPAPQEFWRRANRVRP